MMKRISFFAVFLVLLSVFAGCSDISDDSSQTSATKIIIGCKDNSISFARTIMPATVSADELTYVLAYKNTSTNETSYTLDTEVSVEQDESSTGFFYKNFESGVYIILLYAFNSENLTHAESAGYTLSSMKIEQIRTYAGFSGNATIDTTASSEKNIVFLTANKYANAATGYFSLSISNQNDWQIPAGYAVLAGIYKENSYDDDSRVYPSNGADYSLFSASSSDASFGTQTFSGLLSSGIYSFVLKYKNDSNQFIYEDELIVYANMTSSKSLSIQEVINKVPEAPSGLISAYKEPETDSSGNESGYYTMQLAWRDNSLTETGFTVELLDVSGNDDVETPGSDSAYETLEKSYGESIVYSSTASSSAYEIDESLGINTTTATFKLPLGKRFVTRICAVNGTGNSDWAYLNKTETLTYTDESDSSKTTKIDSSYTPFDAGCETINLYRITYEYNSGTISALKDGTSQAEPATTIYKSQLSSGIAILNPDGITENTYHDSDGNEISGATLTLTLDSTFWNNWYINSEESSVSKTESYIQITSYVSGIKYYSDSTGAELSEQPTEDNFSSGTFYARQVELSPYTGYANVNFLANYK